MRTLFAACRARWRQLPPLTREVTLVLVVKAGALTALWALFFSTPLAPGMNAGTENVAGRIVPPLHASRESPNAVR